MVWYFPDFHILLLIAYFICTDLSGSNLNVQNWYVSLIYYLTRHIGQFTLICSRML